jgi:hypothetical protein
MNKKYIIAAVAAGATLAGCGWYWIKASQRKAAELHDNLQTALRLAQESKFDDSVSLLQSTIEAMNEFYGAADPASIHTVAILAEILRRQNKLPEAEALMRSCCEGLDKALGADHDESLCCHTEFMHILGAAGKTSEARSTGAKLYDRLCKKWGSNHATSVKVGSAVCSFMKQEGDLQQSVDFARIMVENCRSAAPNTPTSPEALNLSLQVLTELLRDSGDIEAAIQIAKESVAVCTASNLEAGSDPQAHYTLLNLQIAVRIEDALHTARCAVSYCKQLYSPQSHQHLESELVLARLLSQNGIYQEAFETWERVFAQLVQKLGPEHHEILDMQARLPIHSLRFAPFTYQVLLAGSNGYVLAANGPSN